MNITSVIFTVPKSGIYFFSFTGVKDPQSNVNLDVDLYHNSNQIARATGLHVVGYGPAALSSTLSLKSGDQISLRLTAAQLYSDGAGHINFNGILLQEEI